MGVPVDFNQYTGGQAEVVTQTGSYRGEIEAIAADAAEFRLILRWAARREESRWTAASVSAITLNLAKTFSKSYGDGIELQNIADKVIIRLYPAECTHPCAADVEGLQCNCSCHCGGCLEEEQVLRIPGIVENAYRGAPSRCVR